MRIVLEKGKQKELINKLKINRTWKELSKLLNHAQTYIRNELRHEQTFISEEAYNKICILLNFSKGYFSL